MDKEQALHSFWGSFGLPAYDQNTVPSDAKLPYFTFEVVTGELNQRLPTSAKLWNRSTDWLFLDSKATEVAKKINEMSPIPIDDGYLYITKDQPFSRRINDQQDSNIKGISFNIGVEFFTNY